MLDQLESNSDHKLFTYNLFASVKLSERAENTKDKALSLGTSRSSDRGVLLAVFRFKRITIEEKKKQKAL